MQTPWKVIGAFVAVFMAGAIFGGFFTLRSTPTPERPAGARAKEVTAARPTAITPAMLQNLRQRLNLTDDQAEKIQPMVARAEQDLQRLRRENFQDTARVMERLHTDITAWLTPGQMNDLENVRLSLQRRFKAAKERGPQGQNELRSRPEDATAATGTNGK